MDMCSPTFTNEEVTKLLEEKGIKEESPQFYQEKCQRFRRVSEDMPGLYIEREDWSDKPILSETDQETMHH